MLDIQNKKKIALVLSGGGIKAAAYHIGVCFALQEKGFKFSGGSKEIITLKKNANMPFEKTIQLYVGSSAGAFISATLASGRSLESLVTAFQVGFGIDSNHSLEKEESLKPIGYRHIFNLNTKRMLSFIPEALMQKSIITGGLEALIKNGFKLNGLFNTRGIEHDAKNFKFKVFCINPTDCFATLAMTKFMYF